MITRFNGAEVSRFVRTIFVIATLIAVGGRYSFADVCTNNTPPTANAGPDKQGSVGVAMTFDGSGSTDANGQVTSYWWNFGDGQYTGWQPNAVVTHVYATSGNFSARLWARDNCQTFSVSDQTNITISAGNPCAGNQAPVANAGNDRNASVNQSINFSSSGSSDSNGSITGYAWNFGDGQSANGEAPSHAFAASGTYTVTLTVTDNCGATASDSCVVTVAAGASSCSNNQAPIANAGPNQQASVGVPVILSGAASTDPNNNIQDYWWNFGDGQFTSWITQTATNHVYAVSGSYSARLWVRDACGSMSVSDTAMITVGGTSNPCANNAQPTANAGPDRTSAPGQSLAFSASGSSDPDGTIQAYNWNFGNGQTASGISVSHSYASAGTYTVTLAVTDNCNMTRSDTAMINIQAVNPCLNNTPPTAVIGGSQSGAPNQSLSFNGSNSSDANGQITSYAWSFGDGSNGTGINVTHPYAQAGTYTVTLSVTDNCGATNLASRTVTIQAVNSCASNSAPIANAGPDRSATINVPINFDGSASHDANGEVVQYWWNFGDGSFTGWQNSAGIAHTYIATGNFSARVWVRDDCGAMSTSDVANVSVAVGQGSCQGNEAPVAIAGGATEGSVGETLTFSASGSYDPDGQSLSYHWSFSDGVQGDGMTYSRAFAYAGLFLVTLTVTDPCGATTTPPPGQTNVADDCTNDGDCQDQDGDVCTEPFCDFATDIPKCNERAIENCCTDNSDCNDGQSCTIDTCNQSTQQCQHSQTTAQPIANAGPNLTGQAGEAITLDGSGSQDFNHDIVSYSWTFGDGHQGTGQSVTHTYANAGTFTATLTVTNECDRVHSDTLSVVISQPSNDNVCCNDSNPCTLNHQEADSGCEFPPGNNGASCDVQSPNLCASRSGTCLNGQCIPDNPPDPCPPLRADFRVLKLVHVDPCGPDEESVKIWEPLTEDANGIINVEVGLRIRFDGKPSVGENNYIWRKNGFVFGMDAIEEQQYTQADQSFEIKLTVYGSGSPHSVTRTIHVTEGIQFLSALPFPGVSFRPHTAAVVGNQVWSISLGNDVGVFRFDDPEHLDTNADFQIVEFDFPYLPQSMAAYGQYLYIPTFTTSGGVRIYKADRENFTEEGQILGPSLTGSKASAAVVKGNALYVGVYWEPRVLVYDLSNPLSPALQTTLTFDEPLSAMTPTAGDVLGIRHPATGYGWHLSIVDVRTPLSPSIADSPVLLPTYPGVAIPSAGGNVVVAPDTEGLGIVEMSHVGTQGASAELESMIQPASIVFTTNGSYVFSLGNYSISKYNVIDRANPYLMSTAIVSEGGTPADLSFIANVPGIGEIVFVGLYNQGFAALRP